MTGILKNPPDTDGHWTIIESAFTSGASLRASVTSQDYKKKRINERKEVRAMIIVDLGRRSLVRVSLILAVYF